tara:strand:+ start:31 stop:366 length:336 start_codon:yes stop_codon:yes gene_type:complete
MRRIEIFSTVLLVSVGFIGFFGSLFGDEEGTGALVAGLAFIVGGLAFFAYLIVSLKKKGCPIWCSSDPSVSGRRRFHRWNETGERDGGYRILECSKCGVRREAPNEWGHIW